MCLRLRLRVSVPVSASVSVSIYAYLRVCVFLCPSEGVQHLQHPRNIRIIELSRILRRKKMRMRAASTMLCTAVACLYSEVLYKMIRKERFNLISTEFLKSGMALCKKPKTPNKSKPKTPATIVVSH